MLNYKIKLILEVTILSFKNFDALREILATIYLLILILSFFEGKTPRHML